MLTNAEMPLQTVVSRYAALSCLVKNVQWFLIYKCWNTSSNIDLIEPSYACSKYSVVSCLQMLTHDLEHDLETQRSLAVQPSHPSSVQKSKITQSSMSSVRLHLLMKPIGYAWKLKAATKWTLRWDCSCQLHPITFLSPAQWYEIMVETVVNPALYNVNY